MRRICVDERQALLTTADGSECNSEECESTLLSCGRSSNDLKCGNGAQLGLNAISSNRCQVFQPVTETLNGCIVGRAFFARLGQCGCGTAGRRNSRVLALTGLFVVEQNRCKLLPHVPFDIVGEHANEDVRFDAVCQTMMNGADVQINALGASERSLD